MVEICNTFDNLEGKDPSEMHYNFRATGSAIWSTLKNSAIYLGIPILEKAFRTEKIKF
jgi:hypothetical protein